MEPKDLRFHKEHEWIRVEGNKATLGISNFAQDALGDVVFVDVPKVGTSLQVNTELHDHPELLNQDPYGKGWIAVLELSNPGEVDGLMTADQYTEFLKSQE
jgi:glycine cleavage system H protein